MTCPICLDPACPGHGYPLMWERYAAGRDVAHWRLIHDRLNGLAPMVPGPSPPPAVPADAALQTYLARHGCCG